MEIRLRQNERDAILDLLVDLKARYIPSKILDDAYWHLQDFAERLGWSVSELDDLATRENLWGTISLLRCIHLQKADTDRMTRTLAHEIAHLFAWKAGLFGPENSEALADSLGAVILETVYEG